MYRERIVGIENWRRCGRGVGGFGLMHDCGRDIDTDGDEGIVSLELGSAVESEGVEGRCVDVF